MSEHVHVHVPEELGESDEGAGSHSPLFEFAAVVLLSAAAIGTAWSGYQASRWSGREAHQFAEAEALHSRSTRAVAQASAHRIEDVSEFERWLDLSTQGNQALAELHLEHFRPELRTAFDAWQAQDPLNNPAAVHSPLEMPQYEPAEAATAASLEKRADRRITGGTDARERADKYVLTTVFFASVLFFAGVSLRIRGSRLRLVVLGLGTALLVYGGVQLIVLPTLY